MMRIGILFSGGKDSTAVLWKAKDRYEVACLMSMLPDNPDSYMFQKPLQELLELQAESLDLPLLTQHTAGEKEAELDELRLLLQRAKDEHGIEVIGVGAIASSYQNDRVKLLCDDLGLQVYAPLWGADPQRHMRDLIDAGFDVRMTRIAADGLDAQWLGRRLTHEDVDRLIALNEKIGLSVGGEGGEFETIVLGGPIFSRHISIESTLTQESAQRAELVITQVSYA